ncbi:MAG: response regulator [Alphaproteobacteria bacterium]|nr:response regulator [Alphaproteobacteria bacterium]
MFRPKLNKETTRILFTFLPGLLILAFAMIALHASLGLMAESETILKHYLAEHADHMDDLANIKGNVIDLDHLRKEHNSFYLSVLALGLMTFLLYVIAIGRINDFRRIHGQNKQYLELLQSQLAAIEAAGDGIGIVDRHGKLTFMNKALMDIHGIKPDDATDFVGHDWTNLYTDKGREIIAKDVIPALQKNGTWVGESTLLRLDGKVVMVELSLRRLNDGSMIGTVRDTSERHKSEIKRKELEQQFYQAQKMEAIGRLAGGIAHDFNNVLAAINGYAEFLTEDLEEGTPQRGYAANILQAGLQARNVVDQILAFSRQKQTGKEPLDMLSPIQETLSMLKASLPKTVELHTDLNAENTILDGNATQISQVIMNLCVNAKDAIDDISEERGTITLGLSNTKAEDIMPERFLAEGLMDPSGTPPITLKDIDGGGVRLTLGTIAKHHNYICLQVSDTGSGMSRTVMEHIFEPFFTTKAVDKGTGLGLATVHGVIASHQGALIVDSTLGKGTTFTLYFPVLESASDTEHQEQESPPEILPGSGNILVVEDQEDVREILTQMLERLGYNAHACENGLDALALLRDEPRYFDLIVTDQNMPTMTGLELVQQVHFNNPDLPFILVSGYSQEKLQNIMKEHPAIKATLRKPVSKDQLARKITEVMAEHRKAA